MSFGAIARSRVLFGKAGTTMAVEKWWSKARAVEGEITQHIAANEQHVILPWLKTFPKKTMDRAPAYLYPIFTALLINFSVSTTLSAHHAEEVSHRF